MAVKDWPNIADRIARENGGEPLTGAIPRDNDKWCYRYIAEQCGVELGQYAFPFECDIGEAILAAIRAEAPWFLLTTMTRKPDGYVEPPVRYEELSLEKRRLYYGSAEWPERKR